VRNLAALSLGSMVRPRTSSLARSRALETLEQAAKRDRSVRVRRAARSSLEKLATARSASVSKKAQPGSVFLHLGKPHDTTRLLSNSDRGELLRAVSRTLKRKAPRYGLATNKTDLPSRAELKRNRLQGFYVGAQVAQLRIRRAGSRAEVSCRVSVHVGPWLGKEVGERIVASKAASASGAARVMGSGSRRGIALSQRDCVVAVAEEVTARQVVPFLRRAAR